MVVGIPTLREICEDKYYNELDGGLLEGSGRLFQVSVKPGVPDPGGGC